MTSIGDNINVTINSVYLLVPFLITKTETQLLFNESIQNDHRIVFDEWYTERRLATDTIYQVDIGSVQWEYSPNYLICAHQTAAGLKAPGIVLNISRFDNLIVIKYFVESDGVRYPRDGVLTNYELNDYLHQNKDVKICYKEYVGEEPMNPFIS